MPMRCVLAGTAEAINLERVSDWLAGQSGTNEALGVCSRDATANRLIVDSVDHGIRQQYLAHRKLTFSLIQYFIPHCHFHKLSQIMIFLSRSGALQNLLFRALILLLADESIVAQLLEAAKPLI